MTVAIGLNLATLIIVVGGGFFFFGSLSAKLDGVRRSLDRQNGTLGDHDVRIRGLGG